MRNSQYRVFISHASPDLGVAKLMAGAIRSVGAETFLGGDLTTGVDMRTELQRQILASNELVALVTPSMLSSRWLPYEAGMAEGAGRLITAITYGLGQEEFQETGFGVYFGHRQWHTLENFDRFLSQLAERIRQNVESEAQAIEPSPEFADALSTFLQRTGKPNQRQSGG